MLQIINYSEKAVAVIGDTKDHADELKALGGRFNSRLTCGAGWIFSKKVLSELEALANGKMEPNNGKQTVEQKRAILEKCGCKGDIDYYVKSYALIVEVGGRYFGIGKPTIETRFCHADEPEDEVREWYKVVRTFEYFRRENMEDLNKAIKVLSEKSANGTLDGLFIKKSNYTGMWDYGFNSDRYYLRTEDEATPMDEKTRQALLKGFRQVAKDFEKRLSAWWKRYGAEKLHVWTYWRDA